MRKNKQWRMLERIRRHHLIKIKRYHTFLKHLALRRGLVESLGNAFVDHEIPHQYVTGALKAALQMPANFGGAWMFPPSKFAPGRMSGYCLILTSEFLKEEHFK